MRVEALRRLWEQHHGVLTPELRERFHAKPQARTLCHYPDAILEQVVPVSPRLTDALAAARREMGLRQDPEEDPTASSQAAGPPSSRVGSTDDRVEPVDLVDPDRPPEEIREIDERYRRDTADEEVPVDVDGYSFDVVEEEPNSSQEEIERSINEYSERTGTYQCHTCEVWLPLEAFEYAVRGRVKVATNCEACRERNRERYRRRGR